MNGKNLSLALLILILTAFCALGSVSELIALHTNDLHGQSLARLATLVEEIREKHPYVLLVDGGDLFSGTPTSYFFQGQAEQEAVLALNYDALAIGNHDFDFGQDVL